MMTSLVFSLLLLLLLAPAHSWLSLEDWGSGSVAGSIGDFGQCVCNVFLPDTSFPGDRVEHMQTSSTDLAVEIKLQINKVTSVKGQLVVLLSELTNLTARLEILQSGPDKYIKLEFEIIRIELRDFATLVTQLKTSLNISSPAIEELYIEIRNMSLIVDRLESYDRSNLEVIRIEFAKLQKKLEKCQDDREEISNSPIGSCTHGGILRFGRPVISQLNANLNAGFKYGGWGKDSSPLSGSEEMYWYAGSSDLLLSKISLYGDYYKLIMRQALRTNELYEVYKYDYRGSGNNYIVRSNALYYQFNNPFKMAKYNLTSSTVVAEVVPEATNRFSYHYSSNQNLDFAADESGLWVTYATEASNGKLVLGKIDEDLFEVQRVWHTSVFKQSVTNAFMICGVLYATRSVDTQTEEVFYTYDTNTSEENYVSIQFEKFQDLYVYLDYNPADQKLYMYNNGYYVYYNVKFRDA
ncbi:Olfactomedin-4 [Triplophysa tibetana]|uniref:Olfactomedin-4 n=1 Tax=Triplophysa tibetana TaxID=1572043 RepID=A0A5A9NPA0_9TELE|nr:Olfactomedin-4 [Triplophysa tibetana]